MKLSDPTALTASMEDYLRAILGLEGTHRVARPKDVAQRLGVHKTTVTAAMRTLAAHGMVNHEPYGVVTLTDDGRRAAEEVASRHVAIRDFLENVLGVDAPTADRTACRMEHDLPREVVDRLVLFTESIRVCPVASNTGPRCCRHARASKGAAARPPATTGDAYASVMHFFNPS